MGDPTRLLSAHSDAEALERALLESLQHAEPSSDAKAAMWSQLAVHAAAVAAVSAGSAIGASAAASSATTAAGAASMPVAGAAAAKGAGLAALVPKTLLAKLLVIGALGSAGGGAVWLQQKSLPTPASAVVSAPAHPVSRPMRSAPLREPQPAPAVAAAPAFSAAPGPSHARAHRDAPSRPIAKPHSLDSLARESRLLTSARAALRAGDLSQTQALLARLSTEFAGGQLRQERDVLQIELLSARGESERAVEAARRFVAAHPDSPHSAKLARFLR
jgi:hypothetical protein